MGIIKFMPFIFIMPLVISSIPFIMILIVFGIENMFVIKVISRLKHITSPSIKSDELMEVLMDVIKSFISVSCLSFMFVVMVMFLSFSMYALNRLSISIIKSNIKPILALLKIPMPTVPTMNNGFIKWVMLIIF